MPTIIQPISSESFKVNEAFDFVNQHLHQHGAGLFTVYPGGDRIAVFQSGIVYLQEVVPEGDAEPLV